MKQRSLVTALLLVLALLAPLSAQAARAVHYFQCADCHRAGSNLYSLSDNLCLSCHGRDKLPVLLNDDTSKSPVGRLDGIDASNAMGSNSVYNAASATQTSHMWGVMGESKIEAGAVGPSVLKSQLDGRYGLSRGRVICNRCHNPHGMDTYDKKILKVDNSRDQLCRDCHRLWATSDPNAFESHPLVADYAAVADPAKFNMNYNAAGVLATNVGDGDVRLLYNSVSGQYMVSCTSCHGVHFTDSDSGTPDGKANYNSLSVGDGKMLRSDGAMDPGGLTVLQLAQKRSNLCQACHPYKLHGDPDPAYDADNDGIQEFLGCLDCHSGHSYNGGQPNYYVLRNIVKNPIGMTPYNVAILYNSLHFLDGGNMKWSDLTSNPDGYCEKCHGDVYDISIGHQERTDNDCKECHIHFSTDSSHTFSFALDPNAAVCGECHGTPPYKNVPGRTGPANYEKGGYAYFDATWNYNNPAASPWTFDESKTAHLTHAGGGQLGGGPNDYRFGGSDSAACEPCHGLGGNPDRDHYDTMPAGSFQDVFDGSNTLFSDLSTANGNLSPAYKTSNPNAYTCSNTYCHSNGFPRTGDGPARSYVSGTIMTPTWNNGDNYIQSGTNGVRCQFCHGNDVNTMQGIGGNNPNPNSVAHIKHLQSGYSCNVCHADTAPDNTSVYNSATMIGNGGTHVNGVADVAYVSSGSPLYNALTSATYDSALGTCSVYCHDPSNIGTTGDWDTAGPLGCTACHGGNAGSGSPMISPAHPAHMNDTDNEVGRNIGCAECHSTVVSADDTVSTPTNHANGLPNLGIAMDGDQTNCDNISCHSDGNYDGAVTYKVNGVDYIWASTTLTGCNVCHGGVQAPGDNIFPDYTDGGLGTGASNSHNKHMASGATCEDCHAGTSTGNALKTGGTALHVDQAVEVSGAKINLGATDATGYDPATETCNNIECHGGNSAVWGDTALACGDCHLGAGDTDDFAYNNATTAKVDLTEWTVSGHGVPTASSYPKKFPADITVRDGADFPGNVNGAGDECKYCHDANVGHGVANFFRLRTNGFSDLNGVCLGCHGTFEDDGVTPTTGVDPDGVGGSEYDPITSAVKIDKYHQGAKHAGTRDGGRWCWDCHDPHGDASAANTRIQMVQRNTQINPDLNGVPASLSTDVIVFYDNTLGADANGGFARDAAPYAEGICNACHTQTQNSDLTPRYQSTTHSGTHSTGKCTTCHQHSPDTTYGGNAFPGSGCNGCHGDSLITGQFWPDGTGTGYEDTDAGAHDAHVTAIGQYLGFGSWSPTMYDDAEQTEICAFCHPDPGGSGHDNDGGLDQTVDLYNSAGPGNYFVKFAPGAGYADDDTGGIYSGGSCSNLACHDRSATPATWNADWQGAPPITPNCTNTCHPAAGNGKGAHVKHVTDKGYDCAECHTDHGTFPGDTTNLAHGNGSVEIVAGTFEAAAAGAGDTTPMTYGGGSSLPYDDNSFDTCASTACHNNKLTPAWDQTDATCTLCHNDTLPPNVEAKADPTSGLHLYNSVFTDVEGHDSSFSDGATQGAASCASCHDSASISGGHIDNAVTPLVAGNFVSTGLSVNLAASPVTCTASCHTDNNTWARQWSTAAYSAAESPEDPRCDVCHGQINTWVSGMTVDHNKAGINAAGNHATCATCHAMPDTDYVWANEHEDGELDWNNNSDLGYNPANGSCTNPTSGCHTDDAAHTVGTSTIFPEASVGIDGPGGSCVTCHGDGGGNQIWPDGQNNNSSWVDYSDNQPGAHEKHVQAIGVYMGLPSDTSTYSQSDQQTKICVFCHPSPGAAGHADNVVPSNVVDVLAAPLQYNGAGGSKADGSSGGYNDVAETCSNIACHDRIAATPGTWNADWQGAPPITPNCTNTCHPAEGNGNGAHATHVATEGYDCDECHSSNGTFPGGTTGLQHGNGLVEIVAGTFDQTAGGTPMSYSDGMNPPYEDASVGTCSSAACHNNLTSPDWNTTGTSCTLCHNDNIATPNTAAKVDPTSGLHLYNSVLTDVEGHDGSFSDGSGPNAKCTSCHDDTNVSSAHIDWNVTALAPGNFVSTGLSVNLAASPVTCTANCHSDNNTWARLWSTDAYSNGTNPDDMRCKVCHGVYSDIEASGWREGTVHYRSGSGAGEDKGASHGNTDPLADRCEDCHAYDSAGQHENGMITFSGNGSAYTLDWSSGTPPGWYCTGCHSGTQGSTDDASSTDGHAFLDSLAFPSPTHATPEKIEYVIGSSTPEGGCSGCHGDSGTGVSGQFWPDGVGTGYQDTDAGAHDAHIAAITDKKYGENIAELLDDTVKGNSIDKQKEVCSYCHPDPGGSNHSDNVNVTGNDDMRVDLYQSGEFKYLIDGQPNSSGIFNYGSADGTCSTIKCHARAPYTPGWHGDTVAPDPVLNLTAINDLYNTVTVEGKTFVDEDEPYSMLLKWSAPGDDDGVDGTAYRYEVRYSTSAITDGTSYNSATIAGNSPTVARATKEQAMIVHGLPTGQTYYFAVKTFDEVGNVTNAATTGTAVAPHPDDFPPEFWGIDKVATMDTTGAVELNWSSARDHTQPLTYHVYWDIGTIDYDNTGTTDNHATTTDTNMRITGLETDIYNFAVRACDGVTPTPNCETNPTILQVLTDSSEDVPWIETSYYASGTNSPVDMVTGTWPGTSQTVTLPAVFAGPTYPNPTNVLGDTFSVYIDNGNVNSEVTAELGYWDGSNFQPFSPQVTKLISIGKRTDRVQSFKFGFKGGKVPATNRVAVQLTQAGGGSVAGVTYGTDTTAGDRRGDLSLKEQRSNNLPAGQAVPTPSGSGIVNITWTQATDPDLDPIHYDIYGDCGETVPWSHIIATGVCFDGTDYDPDCTPFSGDETQTGIPWDTAGAGIDSATCQIKVAAGDGSNDGDGLGQSHTEVPSPASWPVDNSIDGMAPAEVTNLVAETRPKQGSVYLTWTAVGDDGSNHGSRASYYDIRFDTGDIIDEAAFLALGPANQALGEPVPNFSGSREKYELLLPQDATLYYIALRTCDEADNCSLPVKAVAPDLVTEQIESGPKCGICHSTPPDATGTAGNHAKHGYTMVDCSNCHGNDPSTGAQTYGMAHQDGNLVLGFKTATPAVAYRSGTRVYYTNDGQPDPGDKSNVIYEDLDGAGGFNYNSVAGDDGTDDGTCSNTIGCHGPATPSWDSSITLSCSECHGSYPGYSMTDPSNTENPNWLSDRSADAYNRPYDDTSEDIEASPPVDLSGNSTGHSVGQHLKHLNFSFRFSKGNSCRLCHLNNEHADGNVDVNLDLVGAGEDSKWTPYNSVTSTPGTCLGTSEFTCHNSHSDPEPSWDSDLQLGCNNCHSMSGKVFDPAGDTSEIPHVKDGNQVRDCNWCHLEGHPQDDDPSAVRIPVNPAVGIDYRSGGIHLRKGINGRNDDVDGNADVTEAEICWTCHEANGISEWGPDNSYNNGPANNATAPPNGNNYDFGTLSTPDWTTATWYSAYDGGGSGIFAYKSGAIQSTHTVNPAAVDQNPNWNVAPLNSPLAGVDYAYTEAPDENQYIRCSWCHDVHDLNRAANDIATGAPFLRGSWLSSPYPEDGAPQAISSFTAANNYGPVPRAGTAYNWQGEGGYFIDQNSPQPTTAGYTLGTSAGLCVLCHTDNVDGMDYPAHGTEGLWLGTNGHANSSLGGTTQGGANIFTYADRNPVAPPVDFTDDYTSAGNPMMGYVNALADSTSTRIDGFRSQYSASYGFGVQPLVSANYAYNDNNWGVSHDDAITDAYHTFSCSKCHNPHASRLPKLMITNCLDTSHNKWDDGRTIPATSGQGRSASADNVGKTLSNAGSAQNCHRYKDQSQGGTGSGWNKVTPWVEP